MAIALSAAAADLARSGKLSPESVELLRAASRTFLADDPQPRPPIDVEAERVEVTVSAEMQQLSGAAIIPIRHWALLVGSSTHRNMAYGEGCGIRRGLLPSPGSGFMPRTPTSIERTIHFFAATARPSEGRPAVIDLPAAIAAVEAMPFDAASRYLDVEGGDALRLWVDRTRHPIRARLARIRKRDLPQVEDHGTLTPLSIPRTSGLAESIHFVLFPQNVVGCEFNFYGPRPSRIAQYLTTKAPVGGDFFLAPLLRKDVTEQLAHLGELRAMHIKTRASYSATLRQMDPGIGQALDTLAERGNAEVVEVVLKAPRSRRMPGLKHNLIAFVKRVAARDESRTEMGRFTISGVSDETGRIEEVDVLSDFLIARREMARVGANTRAVQSDSAYQAIENAHHELRRDLLDAAGIAPD